MKHALRKIGYAFLVLWGVASTLFALFHMVPGDPARMMLGQRSDEASIRLLRHELGLDLPVGQQYLRYLNDLSPISIYSHAPEAVLYYDESRERNGGFCITFSNTWFLCLKAPYLGRSYQTGKNVSEILAETLPATAVLALAAMVLATVVGVGMGILAALYHGRWPDKVLLTLSALGMAGPSFFVAVLVAWIFAFVLAPYTGLPITGSLWVWDDMGEGRSLALANLILPAFTLGIRPLAVITQLMRNALLNTMSQDFIRTARAKGLTATQVIWRHALRNSISPVLTAISGWFASLLAGAVFVEYIFGWKGMGRQLVDALDQVDLPMVMGAVLTVSVLFVLINMLVDLAYAWIDPRIRTHS